MVAPYVDYLVINVSCPNVDWTKKLGASGDKAKKFMDIIEAVMAKQQQGLKDRA